MKQLNDELNLERRRYNDLLNEKNNKEREIQILQTQLNSSQHKNERIHVESQTLELQVQRITKENNQQLSTSNIMNIGNATNLQIQVLSEQVKKLSVDNANWEKKVKNNELLIKEIQHEKEDLIQ